MTDEERNKWEREHVYPWANDAQWDCICLIACVNGGFHHMDSREIKASSADGIVYLTRRTFSTYDFDELTRLVKLCHQRCIRGEIGARGMKTALYLHKRKREGGMWERHPTWEEVTQ